IAWIAFGTPNVGLYFPISFVGELPMAFGDASSASTSIEERTADLLKLAHGKDADRARLVLALERLQTRFDQDADDFLARVHEHPHSVSLMATEMMESHVHLFNKEYRRLFGVEERPAA